MKVKELRELLKGADEEGVVAISFPDQAYGDYRATAEIDVTVFLHATSGGVGLLIKAEPEEVK